MSSSHRKKEATSSIFNISSAFVRRLVLAQADPAKHRIRTWLTAIDDDRLYAFGLTAADVAALRASSEPHAGNNLQNRSNGLHLAHDQSSEPAPSEKRDDGKLMYR